MDPKTINHLVELKYTSIASQDLSHTVPYANKVSRTIGYTDAELQHVPETANLGLGCGAPVSVAGLKPGDKVLDLGSGPGLDALLAATIVGHTGHITGLDSNTSMLELAESNLLKARGGSNDTVPGNLANIKFAHTLLPSIAMPDESVDVVLSNCVLNLLPDKEKPAVWQEIARVLKQGGRAVVSDVCAKKELSEKMKGDAALLVGCVAGAALVGEVRGWMCTAGFEDISIEDTGKDLDVYKDACCTKEPEGKGCACSCASMCSATSPPTNEDGTGDLNELVGAFLIKATRGSRKQFV